VPLGIVYQTDAAASTQVRIVGRFSEAAHEPIVYPAALLTRSRHPDARAFLDFLTSAEGQAVLSRFGFRR
jgi:molybdate transport system substrate-binding protein